MTRLRVGFIALIAILGFAMLFTTIASAQEVAGLNGTVTDTSGAVVPGVSITLVNTRTNTTYQATTNELGLYSISKLLPGPGYKLTLKRDGFETTVINELYLTVGTTRTENVQLKVGHTNETVEVSAASEGVALNTSDATVGSNFNMNAVAQLPVQVRDSPAALMNLQAGVVPTTATGGSDAFSSRGGAVTGARTDQNNVTLDGLDVNDFATGQAFSTVANAPVDSIQEFRGESAGSLAASGRGSGAQVQMVTKSGTNTFHGSAYDFHRNTALTANNWFNNDRATPLAKPTLIRNQFGATLGGPVVKDKLFFFFSYSGRRQAQSVSANTVVPLDSLRNGIVSYINNTIDPNPADPLHPACPASSRQNTKPTCISSLNAAQIATLDPQHVGVNQNVISFLAERYPRANDLTGGDGINTGGFRFNAPVHRNLNDYVTKIDYNLSSKLRLMGRFSIQREQYGDTANDPYRPIQFAGDPLTKAIENRSWAYVVGLNWTVSPNAVNQFTFGQTTSDLQFPLLYNPADTNRWTFGSGGTLAWTNPYITRSAQGRHVPIPVWRDDLTWQKGNHQIQLGGMFKPIKTASHLDGDNNFINLGLGGNTNQLIAALRPADIRPNSSTAARTYDSAFALILGRIGAVASNWNYDSSLSVLPQGTGSQRGYRYWETETYIQDTWKVTSDLTLTYGLRYQYYSVPYEVHGIEALPNLGFDDIMGIRAANGANGVSGDLVTPITYYNLGGKANNARGIYEPNLTDFAPRFSFAYSPSSNGFLKSVFGEKKMVIRGGAGLIYDHPVTNALNFIQDQNSYMFQASSSRPFGNSMDPVVSLLNDPRFTSINSIPTPAPAPTIDRPFAPFVTGGIPEGTALNEFNYAVDPKLKTPYSIVFNFGIQRELPKHFVMEATYVGRLGRRLIAQADASQLVDFRDPNGGGLMSTAFAALEQHVRAGLFDDTGAYTGPAVPWFENQIGAGGTAAVAETYGSYLQVGDFADTVQALVSGGALANNVGMPPQFAGNTYITNKANSNYHGLLMSLHRNFANGLQFDVNYTFSHSIDNTSQIGNSVSSGTGMGFVCDALNLRVCRGNSDFDVKHVVSGNFIYELPFGKGKAFGSSAPGWANQFIGGWTISGIPVWRSGFAFSSITGAYLMGYANNSPAVFVGSSKDLAVNVHKTDSDGTINLFSDPDAATGAFEFPTGFGIGSRNNLRGPSFFNFDFGVAKRFPVTERFNVQFRADAFNVLNHASFGLPGGGGNGVGADLSSGQFGKITTTANEPRTVQMSLRVEF